MDYIYANIQRKGFVKILKRNLYIWEPRDLNSDLEGFKTSTFWECRHHLLSFMEIQKHVGYGNVCAESPLCHLLLEGIKQGCDLLYIKAGYTKHIHRTMGSDQQ